MGYISPVNGLRTFYIDIKTIECDKKNCFKKRWQIPRVNNTKAIRIENA